MAPKSQSLILLLILTLFVLSDVSASVGGRKEAIVGGYQPIKDLKAKEVQEIAQFAVTEHNKEAKTNLKYQEVLRGETQVVSGINYRLVIEALTGTVPGEYQAVVWVKPWKNYRNLTSFEKFEG